MNEENKRKVHAKYERELQRGERFWPDSIFKDLIVSLGIFILLILLATFVGVPTEPKADPGDTAYIPRPEWYFLFLFKFLALYGQIPLLGKIEWIATVVVPGVGVLALLLLPFVDRNPYRYYSKRILALTVMTIVVVNIVLLTLMSDFPTTAAEGATLATIFQPIAGLVIPAAAILTMFGLAWLKKGAGSLQLAVAGLAILGMFASAGIVLATGHAVVQEETAVAGTLADQIVAGQDLYSVNCSACHGDSGQVATIQGVAGLEGKPVPPIDSHDVLYTLNDDALAQVIAYGRPESGMTPFGKSYGGELNPNEIDEIVAFMRYTWDDRFELPAEAAKPLYPPLGPGEVPSYDVHVAPIVKRYCLSCHRAGRDNNNYLMDSYNSIVHSGDNGPVVTAGDAQSMLLKVIQGQVIADPNDPNKQLAGAMPPTGSLNPDVVDVLVRWVMAGMPETAVDAARLSPTPPAP